MAKLAQTKFRDLVPVSLLGGDLVYCEFKNLLMNAITIEGLDVSTELFVKNALIDGGCVGYDKLTNKWAYVAGTGLNELGDPVHLLFRFANGKTFTRMAYYNNDDLGAYYIKALPLPFSLSDLIRRTANFINNCDIAINQNIDAIKTPYIVVCENKDLLLSVEHAIQDKQSGKPVIVVNEDLGEGLKSININVDYVADKLEIIKEQERDKLLNKLGIMSANTDKRERVQVGEVNATLGQCIDYIYILIDTFNKQMETYGINHKMTLNGAIEELYTDEENEESEGVENDNEQIAG